MCIICLTGGLTVIVPLVSELECHQYPFLLEKGDYIGRSFGRDRKPEALCDSGRDAMKTLPCLEVVGAEYRLTFATIHL